MKLWIDDVRPAPDGFVWCCSVAQAIGLIDSCKYSKIDIELIDIDHDAGDYAQYGDGYSGDSDEEQYTLWEKE